MTSLNAAITEDFESKRIYNPGMQPLDCSPWLESSLRKRAKKGNWSFLYHANEDPVFKIWSVRQLAHAKISILERNFIIFFCITKFESMASKWLFNI